MKKKIAIFASGSGTNFEALAKACKNGYINAEVVLCVCDKPGAFVTERAKNHNISILEFFAKNYSSKAEYERMILTELKKLGVDFICLAGYMRIVGDTLLNEYAGRIINIHPSLLPAFPGTDGIGQAMAARVKVFGVTVHYVDNTLDGGKIIDQVALHYDGSDRDELEDMIHAHEHALYVQTVKKMIADL